MKHILFTTIFALLFLAAFAQAPTSGIVAYFPMNGNFNDAGTNAISATNTGATAAANRNGTANKAMSFLNPSATVTTVVQFATHPVNTNTSFTGSQDFSIDFWVKFNSPFVHAGGIYDNNLNYGGYGVWIWQGSGFAQIQFNYKNASLGTTSGAIILGTWIHVTCVRESAVLKIYLNGILNNSLAEGTLTPMYSFPARIGTMFYDIYPNYNGLNGSIDELRIYNRTLTIAEINTLQVLPLKLEYFNATINKTEVQLKWQTTAEINTNHFDIEYSIDGNTFKNRGSENAKNLGVNNYAFSDNIPADCRDVVYYRLKIIDNDGSYKYSEIVKLPILKINEITIYPNPAQEYIIVNTLKNNSEIQIVNNVGQIVLRQKLLSNNQKINIENLRTGIYVVKVFGETQLYKLIKN